MSDATPTHHLAAVWFADLVGYTALSETNEGDAIRAVSRFQAIVRAVVQTHGGRVVKFLGDGALAEFQSTEQAVRSADALRADFTRVAEAEGLGARELRIGVHVGDVATTEDGDLYGDGVNVASRIQAAADPGEVWVSEDVRRQLRQRPELRFAARGEHALKGLRTPLELHAVGIGESAPAQATPAAKPLRGRGATAPAAPWTQRRAVSLLGAGILIAIVALLASTWLRGRGPDPSEAAVLAVLPFENLSGDEATEPFVLGLHDDLLTHLSQIEAIDVISRTSVLGYRGTTKSVSQIADELGASVILEGGVQRSGDRIRMNVQLIDAKTDEHLWAEQYDRTLTTENVFAIQADVAERIAGAMETALTPEQKADLAEAPTDNLEALDLYYQGLDAYRGRGAIVASDSRNAVHFLERATELDPDFAAAWAALAQARAWLIRIGIVSDTTATRAALDRAAALAPDARETKLAEGVYLYYARADFAGAADRFSAILRRQPDDAEALDWQGLVLRRLGRWDEALGSMERARDADPRNSGIVSNLGVTLLHLRRYDEAERYLDEALVLSSSDDALTNKVILLLWGKGDTRGARGFLEASARDLDPGGYALLDAMVALGERDYESGLETLAGEFIPQDQKPAALYLQALHARLAGRTDLSAVMGDSLFAVSEGQITAYREGGADPFGFQSQLTAFRGLAHALAGRRSEAITDGRRAVEMLPISKDAIEG
ncbi:MAG TPA: adenylate/guanylate cyclase domain-containing protein, partial [Gemmatimonadota bacterium]|nr:adenylate/guanylate cyclase domain-containing protein [Gemmatimonadota bacterium]